MTGAGFDVDPTRLRSASPQFDTVADQVEDAGNALQAALSAEGPCWGGDEAGQTFAQGYLPQAESTMTALRNVVEAVRAIRVSLDASADTWEGCDQSATGTFGGGGGGGGGGQG